jgi:hypothetical protein
MLHVDGASCNVIFTYTRVNHIILILPPFFLFFVWLFLSFIIRGRMSSIPRCLELSNFMIEAPCEVLNFILFPLNYEKHIIFTLLTMQISSCLTPKWPKSHSNNYHTSFFYMYPKIINLVFLQWKLICLSNYLYSFELC